MTHALRQYKANVFQALGHPTRIAIVEALRAGEKTAGRLITELGLEQANASQHLAILRTRQILVNRKEGNQVFYSLRDPVLSDVLEILRRYFFAHLAETQAMLKEVRDEKPRKGGRKR